MPIAVIEIMHDLFTQSVGRFAIHKASKTICIITKVAWFKNGYDYTLAIPQKDNKGKVEFCHATYKETEIKII